MLELKNINKQQQKPFIRWDSNTLDNKIGPIFKSEMEQKEEEDMALRYKENQNMPFII